MTDSQKDLLTWVYGLFVVADHFFNNQTPQFLEQFEKLRIKKTHKNQKPPTPTPPQNKQTYKTERLILGFSTLIQFIVFAIKSINFSKSFLLMKIWPSFSLALECN